MYFYFEQVFRDAVNGINATAVPATMVEIGQAILLICLLFNVYEAWVRGGDVRTLGAGAVKYLVLGLILLNYSPIFLGVNTMFNQVAEYISTVGPGGMDVFDTWRKQAWQYAMNSPGFFQGLWPLVSGGIPGLLETGLLLVGFLVYAVTYPLFCILYAFYGAVLYVCAPLVLALYPALSTTGLARSYLTNLVIFHAWGLIYAILGCLMSAIHLGTVAEVLARGDAGGFFAGVGEALLLGLASILLALCIVLIPMIARRIVQGDVGSTMFAVMSAAVTAATLAASMAINGSVGLARGLEGGSEPQPGSGGGGGGGGGQAQGGKERPNSAGQSSGTPPPRPPEDKVIGEGKGAGASGTEGKAPEGVRNADTINPTSDAAAMTNTTSGHSSNNDESVHGGRSSSPARHWSAGAHGYTPMSLTALAAMGTGTLVGTGLRKAASALRPRRSSEDK